ncbi:MAG: hypothetical protein COB41_10675 [Proteobacteria bacterium]|nr:MAG: hypothetical protein COB41_10675 [Pseudomonadota bacterium]
MKPVLQKISSSMRFVMVTFAMLGAMWSAIDLHQHEDGLHQLAPCVICSLEESVTHGFTLHTAIQLLAPEHDFPLSNWLADSTAYTCVHLVAIRAPPLA